MKNIGAMNCQFGYSSSCERLRPNDRSELPLFGKEGLGEIFTDIDLPARKKSPLSPFAKGGNSKGTSTTTVAKEFLTGAGQYRGACASVNHPHLYSFDFTQDRPPWSRGRKGTDASVGSTV